MKKFYAFIFIAMMFTLTCRPAVMAENSAPACSDYISLVHSGIEYTIAQAVAPDSNFPYAVEEDDDALYISDKTSGIHAGIIRKSLDDEAFNALQDYYNDSTLSSEDLFTRYTELAKSYITAMEGLYGSNYLGDDTKSSETAMRIYYEGSDKLFGLDNCSVYLYNIVQYEGLDYIEQTYLDLIIPDQATSTVIMIKFAIPTSKMGTAASDSIASILSGIRFDGLSPQSDLPTVMKDLTVINASKLGIYPAATQEQPDYELFESTDEGFSILLPTSYVPFIQNDLGGTYSYTSFKINPNLIFSITSEPLQVYGAPNSFNHFLVASLGSVDFKDSGACQLGSNVYSYFAYSRSGSSYSSDNLDISKSTGSPSDKVTQYFYDYYIEDGSKLYKFQLHSAIAEPGSIVLEQFEKILASFNAEKIPSSGMTTQTTPSGIIATTKYMNSDEGYSFSYPEDWQLEDVSSDIAYDRLRLVVPGLSGALEILVQESELKQLASFSDIIKSVNGLSVSSWSTHTIGYTPPFAGKTSKLLYSDFSIDGSIFTIYRLSAFVDGNSRNRLCYSLDILKGHKLYSMFITVGEYKTKDGRFSEAQINDWINKVAASFRMETTKESEARSISGETRNRKIVFVENYLRQTINSKLAVTSVGKTQPDKTLFVAVGSTTEGGIDYTKDSGIYKIKLDYSNRKIEIVNRILWRDILLKELASLLNQYQGKIIMNTSINEPNMTITIKSRDNQSSAPVTRTYRINISLTDNDVGWETVQIALQAYFRLESGLYATFYNPLAKALPNLMF